MTGKRSFEARGNYNPSDFWICFDCGYHINRRSDNSVGRYEAHLAQCAVLNVIQLQLKLHPEVSDPDEEC